MRFSDRVTRSEEEILTNVRYVFRNGTYRVVAALILFVSLSSLDSFLPVETQVDGLKRLVLGKIKVGFSAKCVTSTKTGSENKLGE